MMGGITLVSTICLEGLLHPLKIPKNENEESMHSLRNSRQHHLFLTTISNFRKLFWYHLSLWCSENPLVNEIKERERASSCISWAYLPWQMSSNQRSSCLDWVNEELGAKGSFYTYPWASPTGNETPPGKVSDAFYSLSNYWPRETIDACPVIWDPYLSLRSLVIWWSINSLMKSPT